MESAALAAAVVRATDAERAHVEQVNRLLEDAVAEDDPQAYHRQSRIFHMGLTRPSGMLRLIHMLESAWNVTEPVQVMVHVEHAQRARLHEDHGEMLDAFLAGDVDRLLASSAAHHRQAQRGRRHAAGADTGLIAGDRDLIPRSHRPKMRDEDISSPQRSRNNSPLASFPITMHQMHRIRSQP